MKTALPPGPKTKLPGGQLFAFRRDPLNFLMNLVRDYGDVAHFRVGPQSMFLLNHPDYIKDALVTKDGNFVKGRALERAKGLLGEGLLTSEGAHHRRQRRLAQPAFHRQRINAYGAAMTARAVELSARWQDGATLDIAREMNRLTLSIVGKTLFDAETEAEAAVVGDALTIAMEMFGTMAFLMLLPRPDLFAKLLPGVRRFERAKVQLDEIIYRLINEHRISGADRGDLLSMLLMSRDEESDGQRMTDAQLRDEALTIFLAGHETTANWLTWTWYLLSQHPEAERRLQDELDAVLDGRLPTGEDVPQLPYTAMILAEAMRLYSPAWIIGRRALSTYEAGGYVMPPDSILVFSQYVMHHDERYYPDPFRFDPERWTPEARASRPQFAYFPFGGGSRRCIGEGFAQMEGVLLLAVLAGRWRMKLVPDHKVVMQPLFTLRAKYGMKMTLSRRT